ncbi:MAG TPA: hypothetical protein VGB64_14605 [Actinomycetota bacterium]
MRRKATRIEEIIASAARSGERIHVRVGNGTPVAELWLEGGTLIAATAEGEEHRMGARLLSTGHLASTELERSRSDAIKHGASLALALSDRVRRDVIAALARDEARYALAAALAAGADEVTIGDGSSPEGRFPLAVDATALLSETNNFLADVRDAQTHAPASALPIAADAPSPDLALGPDEWALLSRADGTATIARLAEECGFPQPEASLIVWRLAAMGLVTIEAGLADEASLMAELEAAEDLAAISAAFEHAAAAPAPEPIEELPIVEPEALPEPDAEIIPPPRPADLAITNGDRTVDTQSLLRELASLARAPVDRNR